MEDPRGSKREKDNGGLVKTLPRKNMKEKILDKEKPVFILIYLILYIF